MQIADTNPMPLASGQTASADVASNDGPAYRRKAENAAEKFEGMFIAQMFREMRKVTREFSADNSVFKDRVDGDMLDYADTMVADSMARQHAFGIANAILHQLLPAQGAQAPSGPDATPPLPANRTSR